MNQLNNHQPARKFYAGALPVQIYPSASEMASAAAQEACEYLQQVIHNQGRASVIFACATSQVQFLDAFTKSPGLDWSCITAFHMDEYLGISADHPASFRRFLREMVVEKVHPGLVHYVAGDAAEPLIECARYTRLLMEKPIDLCCLGIGENGHLAFNDPPVARFDDPHWIKIVQLDHACRQQQVGEGCFPSLDAVPKYAYTLTIPTLCKANKMLCIVPDQRKAAAVKTALEGPIQTTCPASILRQQKQAILFLDSNAASQLHVM